MFYSNKLKIKSLIIFTLAIAFVLYVNSAVPFLMLPTLGQAVWTTGFSQSMANNASIFDFYARDIGIPNPAAMAFGLAGAWPASMLIRAGLQAADAYTSMAAFWLCLAMYSAYKLTRFFGGSRSIALSGSVIWMTMPIIWQHSGYSMLSLGIALLSFYFFSALRLFYTKHDSLKSTASLSLLYVVATIVAVFMDGYTFMMFATGSSILLANAILTKPDDRQHFLKVVLPVHIFSFALAYTIFRLYVGKSNFAAHQLDFFRGWGLDLSFLVIPTKGILWLPDLLGISIPRSNETFFGDSSVWKTTFALPILILGIFAWFRARTISKLSTGLLLISIFGFYMALGPSLKINSTKPQALQKSHPREQSILMASEYAVAPTGNAWISKRLPGFNVMRASYRWASLGIFGMWLLIMINLSKANEKKLKVWHGLLFLLLVCNLPDFVFRWQQGTSLRAKFLQIDRELVSKLSNNIQKNETAVFLPWGNDFMANYLAPKVGFRTPNIGGDKNLDEARLKWPETMRRLGSDQPFFASNYLKILLEGHADVIIVPYFTMLKFNWPCKTKDSEPVSDCLKEKKSKIQNMINVFKELEYIDVHNTELFSTIRLKPEFLNSSDGSSNRRILENSLQRIILNEQSHLFNEIRYPIAITPDFPAGPYVLQDGWHDIEAQRVWSKSNATLLLPLPQQCQTTHCQLRLNLGVFGSSQARSVDVFFNSMDQGAPWSNKITSVNGDPIVLDIPFDGVIKYRKVKISIPDATSPLDLIGSSDARILGVSLYSIELLNQ